MLNSDQEQAKNTHKFTLFNSLGLGPPFPLALDYVLLTRQENQALLSVSFSLLQRISLAFELSVGSVWFVRAIGFAYFLWHGQTIRFHEIFERSVNPLYYAVAKTLRLRNP